MMAKNLQNLEIYHKLLSNLPYLVLQNSHMMIIKIV